MKVGLCTVSEKKGENDANQTSNSDGSRRKLLKSLAAGGGCTDWYLPSQGELNQLYLQQTVVGGFASTWYWSSSEGSAFSAWGQNFNNSVQFGNNKNNALGVRAVRSF